MLLLVRMSNDGKTNEKFRKYELKLVACGKQWIIGVERRRDL